MKKFHFLFVLLALLMLSLTRCAKQESDLEPVTEFSQELEIANAKQDIPIEILTPTKDVELRFFAWEDGSAGVLEVSKGSSFTVHEKLENASPAEVYWACSTPGKAIPQALVAHHNDVAQSEGMNSFARLKATSHQGWALSEGQKRSSPCLNSTFTSKHCGPNSTYPDRSICKINTSGNWVWTTGAVRRYKTGFCLQDGVVNDYLYYTQQANNCYYVPGINYIWGASNNQYHADTYLSWYWWAGTFTQSRKWKHKAFNGNSGDVYDWGFMTKKGSICVQ